MPSQNLFEEQERLFREGAAQIAQSLQNRAMLLFCEGRLQLVVRFLQDNGRNFAIEWFKGFQVIFWLSSTPDIKVTYSVERVDVTKKKWYFLVLSPASDHDQRLSMCVEKSAPGKVNKIELVANGECLLFVWDERLKLFLLQQRH